MPEQEAGAAVAPPPKPDGPTRSRPIKTLPTERIQFSKQLDILRAFAAASGPGQKPVTNKMVADLVKMVESTVSMSNAFFTDTGLIIRTGGGFIPSADVMNYQRAFEWNPETAAHKLAPILKATWFGQRLITRLSYEPIEDAAAVQALAEEAAATKDYQRQVSVLVDYLESAGILARENGMVRLGPTASNGRPDAPKETPEAKDPPSMSMPSPRGAAVVTSFATPMEGVVQFHVSVKVDMGEFKSWTPDRIAAFFGGIAQVLAAKGKVEESASGS